MTLKIFLLTAVLFLASSNLFARNDEPDKRALLRHQAMDEEVRKLTGLREKKMDEAVNRFSEKAIYGLSEKSVYGLPGGKEKPRFFFTLRGRLSDPSSLKTIML